MSANRIGRELAIDIVSATAAVVFATGVLAICVAIVSGATGSTIPDLYETAFPRTRGGGGTPGIPTVLTVSFVLYVAAAAQITIVFRRMLEARRRRRLS
jgi:hypothetical protein